MNSIYLVITSLFPTKNSFRGSYVYDQVKAIRDTTNFKVVVLRPCELYKAQDDYCFEGVNVHYFKSFDLPSSILPGIFNNISFKFFSKKLTSLNIKISDVKVVHSHVTPLGIYANYLKQKKSSIKTILQHHGYDVLSISNGVFSKFKWHRKWVEKYGIEICNNIDLHVGVSNKTLDKLLLFPKITIKSTYVLYNGVDKQKFYKNRMASESSYFTIGCIGNFWSLKDQMTLIKAVHLIVNRGDFNIRVKFIGSGSTLQLCKDYVAKNELKSNIKFLEEVRHIDLNNFYNSLNLFVLPSFYEAFGCVYVEAFSCAVPFIGVKGQGISELIPEKEKSRWLIEKRDFTGLANMIESYRYNNYKQNLLIDIDIRVLIKEFIEENIIMYQN